MVKIEFRYVVIFVIIILSLQILVSGCMFLGGNVKIEDLRKNSAMYGGRQIILTGRVYDGVRYIGSDGFLHDEYYFEDGTGAITIQGNPPVKLGTEVSITGIYHSSSDTIEILKITEVKPKSGI